MKPMTYDVRVRLATAHTISDAELQLNAVKRSKKSTDLGLVTSVLCLRTLMILSRWQIVSRMMACVIL
jgi:hypothetical protein